MSRDVERPRAAVHRTVVVVDVERFGDRRRTIPHQVALRDGLYRALQLAFDSADALWGDCDHEDRGDGVLVLAPAEVPKGPLAVSLTRALVTALSAHNSTHPPEQQIRLRMAMHAGEVAYDGHGVTATSINLAFRLLDAKPLKAALAESPGVLAVITSGWFFDEVIRHTPDANPSTHRPARVAVKETATIGWISLPDHPYPPDATVLTSPPHEQIATPRWPVRVGAVPLSADCYQDRDVTLALEKGLDTSGTVVLVPATTVVAGMGGVGKTQIAARHIRPLWDDPTVDLAVWITAVDGDAIATGYAHTARAIGQASDQSPAVAAHALLNWLSTTDRRWVIVLDDLQDPDHIKGWWPPQTTTGHTAVTTRRRDAALRRADRTIVEVEPYTAPESLSYLHAKLADYPALLDGAAALAGELRYLPLALAQAVAYLIDEEITCEEYRQRFRAGWDVTPDRLPDDHQRTVDRTWELSIDHADQLKPVGLARPLLELLSLLDPNGIPSAVISSAAVVSHLAERTGRPTTPADAQRAVRCLHRLSLATTDPAQPQRGVRVHALVQHAARAKIQAADEAAVAVTAADALAEIWPDIERNSDLAQSLRTNTTELEHHAGVYLWHTGAHGVFFRHGRSLGEAGLVSSARSHFEHLQTTADQKLGPHHPDTLSTRHDLAHWRGTGGDVAGAAADFEQLLADRLRVLGADHPSTLLTRHGLAYWRGEGGDVAGAVAEFKRLLADRLRVLGADHPSTLLTRQDLAYWRGTGGDVAGAVADFEQLLADRLRVLGADHPQTLIARGCLPHWRGMGGDVAGAVADFEQLLAHRLRVLGANHPDTLLTRHDLAYWRGEGGDVAGAATEFEQLLTDRLRVLGKDHPHTLTTRGSLAYWRGEGGDVAGAAAEFEQLLTDRLRVLGKDHPSTLITRHDLAHSRGARGDVAGAVVDFEQLLTDRLRVLGKDHPSTLITRHGLAHWRGEGGDVAGAATEFEQLLTDRLRVLGKDHPHTLTTRGSLAHWRGEGGDVAGAAAEFEQLLTDRLRVLGKDHPSTLITRGSLARWRGEGGDVAGAVADFERLLADSVQVLGKDHPSTLKARNNLGYWRKPLRPAGNASEDFDGSGRSTRRRSE